MRIGFIGLGIMGKPMARRLLAAEHALTVYNRSQAALEELRSYGAVPAASPMLLAQASDIVITMLPDAPDVMQVVCGSKGVLSGAKSGMILVDASSVAPEDARGIGKACDEARVEMLDAPVSGGERGALEGTLSFMVGEKKEAFDFVKDRVLLQMGNTATYCGGLGSGNVAKLANQMIVAGTLAICAEAFTMAKKAGVDPATVYQAIKNGLAGSRLLDAKIPMMINGQYPPGFKLDLHAKDLCHALDTAKQEGAVALLTAQIAQMMHGLQREGLGNLDHSVLSAFYEKMSGVSLAVRAEK